MGKEILCGVYQIKNDINGLFYIGSSNNIYYRWDVHKRFLKNNKHGNYLLQDDWNQFGESAFSFTIIELCSSEEQFIREQYYIDSTNCWVRGIGYNILKDVNEPPVHCGEDSLKAKHTNEQIKNVIKLLSETDLSLVEISKKTGVNYGAVSAVYNRESWRHLSDGKIFRSRHRGLDDKDIVNDIIPRILSGEADSSIAKDYHINERSIALIRNHKNYKHLTKGVVFETHKQTCEDANPAKLKNDDVLEIIRLYNSGVSPTELMEKYSVGRHAILDILHKVTWSNLTKDIYIRPVESKIKLTEDDVKTIIYKLKHGATMQSLADEYHVNNTAIQKIKYGVTWKHIDRDSI